MAVFGSLHVRRAQRPIPSNRASPSSSRRHSPPEIAAICGFLVVAFAPLPSAAAYSPPSLSFVNNLKSAFGSVFGGGAPAPAAPSSSPGFSPAQVSRREELKSQLLGECSRPGTDRAVVESILEELSELRPVRDTATSPLLRRRWDLIWTTEKEINFFDDWGISSGVSQTIGEGGELGNLIEFKRGGGLSVSGELSVEDATMGTGEGNDQGLVRTNFKFTLAKLDLDKWGSYEVPPIGEGWFDTLYLDEDLRADLNSRDDILICSASKL